MRIDERRNALIREIKRAREVRSERFSQFTPPIFLKKGERAVVEEFKKAGLPHEHALDLFAILTQGMNIKSKKLLKEIAKEVQSIFFNC